MSLVIGTEKKIKTKIENENGNENENGTKTEKEIEMLGAEEDRAVLKEETLSTEEILTKAPKTSNKTS